MKDAPAFDFYPERWLVGVALFSDAEQLSYLRLLCHQWLSGDDGLPGDPKALKRLAGKGVTGALLEKFPLCEDGARRNARLETIRQQQRERIITRKIGAAIAHAKTNGVDSLSDDERELLERAGKLIDGVLHTGKRSASKPVSNLAEPIASNLPPPTTHHPPRKARASSRAREAELPTLTEVTAYAQTVLAPPECAERFFNDCEGSGWVNRHGQPIADWRPIFRNYATNWKAREAQGKQRGQKTGDSRPLKLKL